MFEIVTGVALMFVSFWFFFAFFKLWMYSALARGSNAVDREDLLTCIFVASFLLPFVFVGIDYFELWPW